MSDDSYTDKVADVIYRVPIIGASKGHVDFFAVMEHKSYQDVHAIFQLWGYAYQKTFSEYQRATDRGEVKVDYQFSPIVGVIFHHGKTRLKGATELANIFAPLPGLEEHYPRFLAILFDLSCLDDDDPILHDPEVPELRVVLMVMNVYFRADVTLKISEVLQALKPHSDDPVTQRVIRATWVYLVNKAKHLRKNLKSFQSTIQEITGETNMPTMGEIWKREGIAIGKAEGKTELGRNMVLAVLRGKFGNIPQAVEKSILAMTDPIALESLAVQVVHSKTMEEFAEALR